MSFDFSNYITAEQAITIFVNKYPDGSLQSTIIPTGLKDIIVVEARAYRNPDDLVPGIGHASNPYPGKTGFDRDSELMNAETAARRRAIQALGLAIGADKKIDQVRNEAKGLSLPIDEPPAPVDKRMASKRVEDVVDPWVAELPPEFEVVDDLPKMGEKASGEMCVHGPRVFRTGLKKNGQPWSGWFCDAASRGTDAKCEAVFRNG